jgi:hypothetical protein
MTFPAPGILVLILCIYPSILSGQDRSQQYIEDTTFATPVRPGLPGHIPFWNQFSRRFIFPPAFEFVDSTNAPSYRFTVTSVKDSQEFSSWQCHSSAMQISSRLILRREHYWRRPIDYPGSERLIRKAIKQ